MKKSYVIALAFMILLTANLACGPLPAPEPTATPVPTQAQPTSTPIPPTPVPPTQTSGGDEIIGGKSGGETPGASSSDKAASTPTPTPGANTSEGGSKGDGGSSESTGSTTLALINQSGVEICFVYISPSSSDQWGMDWLGETETVMSGAQRTFDIDAGIYDLLATDCTDNVVDERYSVSITGAMDWTVGRGAANNAGFTLYNNSGVEICYVYISPSSSSEWGSDWLGNVTVPNGNYWSTRLPMDTYDMLAEDCNGYIVDEQYGVALTGNSEWSLEQYTVPTDTTLTIINDTAYEIWYVYISPSSSSEWGNDWLGDDVIPAYGSYTFYVSEGTYDLRVEDSSYNVMASRFEEYLTGDSDWTIYLEDEASVTLYNNSDQSVCFVYISPSSSSDWGGDWLGESEILESGYSRSFYLPSGTYDLAAESCDGYLLDEQYSVYIDSSIDWSLNQSVGTSSASLTISNDTDSPIWYVYISPSWSDDWGEDWLGSDQIPAYDSRTFYVSEGTYDLMVEDDNGNVLATRFDEYVSGDMAWTIYQDQDASVTLYNQSGYDICWIYISPSSSSDWGGDWLGTDILPWGESRIFYMPEGSYDFQAVDCDEYILDQRYDLYISGDTYWTIE
jgi:hypothetical protein